MTNSRSKFDWSQLATVLAPATEHAAVGERVPRMSRVPAPIRWTARMTARCVYGLASPITRRQAAVNQSLLGAVEMLGARVRELEGSPAPSAPTGAAIEFVRDTALQTGPRSFMAVANQWSLMLWPERVVLYSTVYGLRPSRCLEIGTALGGSAQIIVAALDDIGAGKVVCVDPSPKIPPESWDRFRHRATVVAEPSPQALKTAEEVMGGKFDFALIDGDHHYEMVIKDIEGTLPVLDDRAFLLFHDAHNEPVDAALRDMFAKHKTLTDVGMMSALAVDDATAPGVRWGGLRLVRFDRTPKE